MNKPWERDWGRRQNAPWDRDWGEPTIPQRMRAFADQRTLPQPTPHDEQGFAQADADYRAAADQPAGSRNRTRAGAFARGAAAGPGRLAADTGEAFIDAATRAGAAVIESPGGAAMNVLRGIGELPGRIWEGMGGVSSGVYHGDPGAAFDAAVDTAVASGELGLLAMGARAPQSAASRPAAPVVRSSPMSQSLDDFKRANVTPTVPTVRGDAMSGRVTKAISENPAAGMPARGQTARQMRDAAAQAERLADRYGAARTAPEAGGAVQQGVRRFADAVDPQARVQQPGAPLARRTPVRDLSVNAKSGALYDDALEGVNMGRVIRMERTREVAESIAREFSHHDLRRRFGNSEAQSLIDLVGPPERRISRTGRVRGDLSPVSQTPRAVLDLGDVRALRTRVRMMADDPNLRHTIPQGQLQRLEAALSDDLFAAYESQGALRAMRQADVFYGAAMGRVRALQRFGDRKASPEQVYRNVINAARAGRQGDINALRQLRRSVRADEWDTVSATILRDLGRPTASRAHFGEFSVNDWVTGWNKMSPDAREVLFARTGSSIMDDLNATARTLGRLKGFEQYTNFSNTASAMQTLATIGAGAASVPLTATVLTAAGATGRLLTSPTFTRIMAQASQLDLAVAMGLPVATRTRQIYAALIAAKALEPHLAAEYDRVIQALPEPQAAPGLPPDIRSVQTQGAPQ